jgi:hypothetical protein
LFHFRFHFRQKNSVSVPQIFVFVSIFSFRFRFSAEKSESFHSTFIPSHGAHRPPCGFFCLKLCATIFVLSKINRLYKWTLDDNNSIRCLSLVGNPISECNKCSCFHNGDLKIYIVLGEE